MTPPEHMPDIARYGATVRDHSGELRGMNFTVERTNGTGRASGVGDRYSVRCDGGLGPTCGSHEQAIADFFAECKGLQVVKVYRIPEAQLSRATTRGMNLGTRYYIITLDHPSNPELRLCDHAVHVEAASHLQWTAHSTVLGVGPVSHDPAAALKALCDARGCVIVHQVELEKPAHAKKKDHEIRFEGSRIQNETEEG
jgi:hypothetical protein